MPVFRNISSAKRTEENGLLGIEWVNLLAFLWTAQAQSGFSDFNGRMQCDPPPTMWRKRLDLVKPLGMPFVASHKPFMNSSGLLTLTLEHPNNTNRLTATPSSVTTSLQTQERYVCDSFDSLVSRTFS